jgi:hypothetical protein
MITKTQDSSFTALEDSVNEIFCNMKPGYAEKADDAVMTTPIIVAAAATVVIGSTLCLIC